MPAASTFDRIVPLPRTLQLITVATFLMSLADFIIGMLDLGTAGFFLNVAAAGFTMVHDSTVVWYARRIYPNEKPTFFPPAASPLNIMFLGACVFTYTVACGMLVWTSTAVFDADGTVNWGTPAGPGTVITQVILSGTCAAVLAYEALWCLRSRSEGRQYGYGHLF